MGYMYSRDGERMWFDDQETADILPGERLELIIQQAQEDALDFFEEQESAKGLLARRKLPGPISDAHVFKRYKDGAIARFKGFDEREASLYAEAFNKEYQLINNPGD